MNTYEEFRDALVALKTEQAAALQANKIAGEKIRAKMEMILDDDISTAQMHGIDVNYVLNIDTELLGKDREYREQVKINLSAEIDKLCELLRGMLQ